MAQQHLCESQHMSTSLFLHVQYNKTNQRRARGKKEACVLLPSLFTCQSTVVWIAKSALRSKNNWGVDCVFERRGQKSHDFWKTETNAWRTGEGGRGFLELKKRTAWPRPHLLLRCCCGRWWPVISVLSVKGQITSEQCLAGQVQKPTDSLSPHPFCTICSGPCVCMREMWLGWA